MKLLGDCYCGNRQYANKCYSRTEIFCPLSKRKSTAENTNYARTSFIGEVPGGDQDGTRPRMYTGILFIFDQFLDKEPGEGFLCFLTRWRTGTNVSRKWKDRRKVSHTAIVVVDKASSPQMTAWQLQTRHYELVSCISVFTEMSLCLCCFVYFPICSLPQCRCVCRDVFVIVMKVRCLHVAHNCRIQIPRMLAKMFGCEIRRYSHFGDHFSFIICEESARDPGNPQKQWSDLRVMSSWAIPLVE